MIKNYDDSNWRNEYIDLCGWRLTKRQVELLEKGPDSLSSSWILGAMHNDWRRIKGIKIKYPNENTGQCQSSLSEFEESIKKYRNQEN
tara:strand:+ start:317 stop:580 length:264 start_codon:yes stop_codon:yes gene_type:complete